MSVYSLLDERDRCTDEDDLSNGVELQHDLKNYHVTAMSAGLSIVKNTFK